MNVFKLDYIENCTDAGSFERGEQYYHQQKLSKLSILKVAVDETLLQSEVEGSDDNVYEQEISIGFTINDAFEVHGRCSCPVHVNCKHIVASLFGYLNHESSVELDEDKKNWLNQIVVNEEVPENLKPKEFVAYLLKKEKKTKTVSVSFRLTHWLVGGAIAKGRTIQLHSFNNRLMLPAYANQKDMEIAQLLEKLDDDAWDDITLVNEAGYTAIKKMIATKHLFWVDNSYIAIRQGDRRTAELVWNKVNKKNVKLDLKILPDAYVIQTSPAWYMDGAKGEIGALQGASFTPHQWQILEQLPEISIDDVEKYSSQLSTMLPGTPTGIEIGQQLETLEITQPPVVNLFLSRKNMGYEHYVHYMRIRFMYDKYELQPLPKNPLSRFSSSKRVVNVNRDLEAEQSAIELLKQEGFTEAVADTGGDIEFVSGNATNSIEAAARWQYFLTEVLPKFKKQGWNVDVDEEFNLQFHSVGDWQVAVEDDQEWFDLRFDLDINGKKVPLLPLISEILANYEPDKMPEMLVVPISESEYINVPSERLRPICQILYELHDKKAVDENGKMRLNRFDATRLSELEETLPGNVQWIGGADLRQLGKNLKDFNGIETVEIPKGLNAVLREYQHQGLDWLQFLREYQFGGILADDMGLGKTVQTLANLLLEKEQGRLSKPCLIVAPTSLMSNWRRESEKFSAELRVLVIHGAERHEKFKKIPHHDLILTTYPLLARDREEILENEFYYLVLDEAQNIKNPNTKAARIVREIKTDYRLCLTGTPMENHLGELWAQLDFLMPGLLGNATFFKRQFRTPIEKHQDGERQKQLVKRVAPFMLRRKKSEVIEELPEKVEIVRSVVLDSKQAALYESIRLSMEKQVRDAISKKGLARSHIMVLDALLKLRQTCCDPGLLSLPQAEKINESAKLETLMEMVPELLEEGRRILLFSQFTSMLSIIEKRLSQENIKYALLTGKTRDRDQAIEKFKKGDADIFLISLKAGGVGLNLTEADTVIHYDPWWNPAAENQATDRAHRIGQNKAVFVYKLITENSVEEKILALQAKKQALLNGVYKDDKSESSMSFTVDDLEALFSPLS